MNLTKFAVLFVIITLPFYMVSDIQVRRIQRQQMVKAQYETIINNAVDDGTLALRLYSESSYEDDLVKAIAVDSEEVLNAFLASYHYGFNVKGETDRVVADSHILAVIIVAYDGYYIYGTKLTREGAGGIPTYKRVLSDKLPFIYREGDTSVFLTLDDRVEVLSMDIDPVTGESWPSVEGTIDDPEVVALLPSGLNSTNFEDTKNYVIGATIEKALTRTVADHNVYTKNLGMSYQFHLPISDAGGYGRNIKDLSLLVFIQGKDIGYGETMSMNAFNSGSVLALKKVLGYEQLLPGGGSEYYYCDEDHSHGHTNMYNAGITNNLTKVFTTKEEAAMDGYYPCQLIGK